MFSLQLFLRLLLITGIFTVPVTAFTINDLSVNIGEEGDAQISVHYSLSWIERVFVFGQITHPDQHLEKALEGFSGKNVTVTHVSPANAELFIEEFIQVDEKPEETIYTTPSMDFSLAEQQSKAFWFSRLVNVDASPEVTLITFPDGYQEKFFNVAYIPSVAHQTGN